MRLEAPDHPADRRLAVASAARVDGTGHDQAVDGARHGDVVEAEALLSLLRLACISNFLVTEHRPAVAARRVHHPEAEATVGQRQDLVGRRWRADVAARVGDDHDLELETLGRVDRQQPDDVGAFLLGHRLELPGADRLLIADERDETLDVGSADRLVRPGEPCELAQVRVPPPPVPAGEDSEVVLDEDQLAEPLERDLPRRGDETFVPLEECTEQTLVVPLETGGKLLLERGEERTACCVPPEEQERVVRDADERRGEHGRERLVVVPVLQQAQVREQVDDLLLPEVAAAGRPEGRQAGAPELFLVDLRVGARGEEKHDLPGYRCT